MQKWTETTIFQGCMIIVIFDKSTKFSTVRKRLMIREGNFPTGGGQKTLLSNFYLFRGVPCQGP